MTTNLSALTTTQVQHLTPEELTPILKEAYGASHGHPMDKADMDAALDAVAQSHWAPGLPARNAHPAGMEAGLAELYGEPEPFLCHHSAEPGTCVECYAELRQRRK